MAAAATPNLGLPQWVAAEKPERTDFNAAFLAIDGAVIIASGSNAYGSYVQFADGTMICYGSNVTTTAIDTVWGGVFINSVDVTITFPIAFIAAPSVSSTSHAAGNHALLMHSTLSNENFVFRLMRGASIGSTSFTLVWTAIGRWEA